MENSAFTVITEVHDHWSVWSQSIFRTQLDQFKKFSFFYQWKHNLCQKVLHHQILFFLSDHSGLPTSIESCLYILFQIIHDVLIWLHSFIPDWSYYSQIKTVIASISEYQFSITIIFSLVGNTFASIEMTQLKINLFFINLLFLNKEHFIQENFIAWNFIQ